MIGDGDEDDKLIPVKVALRIRPLSQKEVSDGAGEYLKIDQTQVTFGRHKIFAYDYVFSKTASQVYVYETAVRPLLNSLFKGYNVTVLAYGQTGSGKTYTMGSTCLRNNNDTSGIIPRVLNDLFTRAQDLQDVNFSIKVSFVEIYNEDFKDLLCNAKQAEPLKIVEDNNSLKILNLTERVVSSVESTRELIDKGTNNRVVAATVMNDQSSRSHAIFTITLEQRIQSRVIKSKFHLVDLAGSERQSKTKAEGLRLKEGISINLGLLALGHVIRSLSDDDVFTNKNKHIPYRESKLTRLLKDSLGGNSVTLMIACVSPADCNMEETLNTLRFADRGRKMENKPVLNIKEIVEKPMPVKKIEVKAPVVAPAVSMPVIFEDEEEEEEGVESRKNAKRKNEKDEKLSPPAKKRLDEKPKKEKINFLLRNKLQCSSKAAAKRNVSLNTTCNAAATPRFASSMNKSVLSSSSKKKTSGLNTTVASANAPKFVKKVLFPSEKINLATKKFLQDANKIMEETSGDHDATSIESVVLIEEQRESIEEEGKLTEEVKIDVESCYNKQTEFQLETILIANKLIEQTSGDHDATSIVPVVLIEGQHESNEGRLTEEVKIDVESCYSKQTEFQLETIQIVNVTETVVTFKVCGTNNEIVENKVISEVCVSEHQSTSTEESVVEIPKLEEVEKATHETQAETKLEPLPETRDKGSKRVLCDKENYQDKKPQAIESNKQPALSSKENIPILATESNTTQVFGSLSNNQCHFLFSQLVNQQEKVENPFTKNLTPTAIFNGKLNNLHPAFKTRRK